MSEISLIASSLWQLIFSCRLWGEYVPLYFPANSSFRSNTFLSVFFQHTVSYLLRFGRASPPFLYHYHHATCTLFITINMLPVPSLSLSRCYLYSTFLIASILLQYDISEAVLSHSSTYLPTPWSRVRLEELTGFQLVEKSISFYGTRRFITAVTSARHLSLSWASSIQSIPHIPFFEDPF